MEEKIICKECGQELPSLKGLNNHLIHKHQMFIKDYYDKWIKIRDEDNCKICGGKTEFYNFKRGYRDTCKKECANIFRFNQIKKTFKEKYGDEIILNRKDVFEKGEITRLKKYGHRNPAHGSNKVKVEKTCKKRYGTKNYMSSQKHKREMSDLWNRLTEKEKKNISEKRKNTNLKKYGVSCSLQNNKVHEKSIKTMLEKYGVENPIQNKEISERIFKTSFKLRKFRNTDLWYQGTYELDFLEKFYDKCPDIQRGPSIKYNYLNKERIYLSDFFIPSLNLIIEIKNKYLFNRDKKMIKEKEKAVEKMGYKYIIIIDKNYENLENGLIFSL